ncbi:MULTISPECIES: DUF2089 family protein [Staphylococcus]|uniref:DUF2089 family protein n=1 Tax=Staphylococcus equorum TaxID=246432 RepID=A0AAW7AHY2_9STAP|nr:DUF2089 family protein [Staphylococcus equorum]MDK9865729.1 DUF2089 family protein [Staphylococcus equorum]
MANNKIPLWLEELNIEDIEFMRKFIINSGSLKLLAKDYEVSYPTIRSRLNELIEKINNQTSNEKEPMVSYIKKLAIEDKLSLDVAQLIINKYENDKDE